MALEIKICGLTTSEALAAALDGGADLVGFVFFPPSPRNILGRRPPAGPRGGRPRDKVALSVDAADQELAGHRGPGAGPLAVARPRDAGTGGAGARPLRSSGDQGAADRASARILRDPRYDGRRPAAVRRPAAARRDPSRRPRRAFDWPARRPRPGGALHAVGRARRRQCRGGPARSPGRRRSMSPPGSSARPAKRTRTRSAPSSARARCGERPGRCAAAA